MIENKIIDGTYKRTHVYASNKSSEPKYLFKIILEMVSKRSKAGVAKFLDLGGASGELSWLLASHLKDSIAYSLDCDPELIKLGRCKYPNVDFIHGDSSDLSMFDNNVIDFVTSIGLLGVFDDPEKMLSEAMRVLKKNGYLIVCDHINDDDVDVVLRYKYSGSDVWNIGHNIFSKSSMTSLINKIDPECKVVYKKFTLPFDLPKKKDDPIRTWTEFDLSGKRVLRNGLGMIVDLQFAIIQKL